MKTIFPTFGLVAAIMLFSCGKSKKGYVCTSPTFLAATQADYDNGYTPDKKEGYVGQEYMQGSSSTIHHKTEEECLQEIATWEGEGYKCEWK